MNDFNQKTLLTIVKNWRINLRPEFRGFRCAVCQEYVEAAWHYWLAICGFITSVHFCNTCNQKLKTNQLELKNSKTEKSITKIQYGKNLENKLREIRETWQTKEPPKFKEFTCDKCMNPLPNAQGYHAWFSGDGLISEFHFDRKCAHEIGLIQL